MSLPDNGKNRGGAEAAGATAPAPGLRANRNWRKLWLGQLVSQLGDYVFDVTIILWVGTVIARGQTWAPIAVSGVLIAATVPTVLVGPIAGVFVDRWNRKRTMMGADLVRGAVIGALMIVPSLGTALPRWAQLAAVYSAVAGASAAAQFFNPSRFATIGAVVAQEDLPKAFSLSTATANAATVLGPPLAAPLLFSVGVRWAIAVNMCSFLASYALIRLTRIPADPPAEPGHRKDFRAELSEGWRFLRGNRVLKTIVVAVFLYMFGVGAINVLEVFFVSENLHVASSWLGTLNGALGTGCVIGALLASRVVARAGTRRVFGWGILVTALLVLLYSRSSSLVVTIVMLGLLGMPLAMVNTVVGPLILEETPNRLLGRVNAVLNPLVYLASVSSMILAGFAASSMRPAFVWSLGGIRLHRIDTIFMMCSFLMILAGVTAIVRLRSLRESAPAVGAAEAEPPPASAAVPVDITVTSHAAAGTAVNGGTS